MIVFISSAIYFLVLFSVIEGLSRKFSLHVEISRKMAHILAGVSAAFLPLVMPFSGIIILALLFLIVMLISRKARLLRSIHDVQRRSYGELFFPLAIAITALIAPNISAYMYGILVMALGDGLAGLLGARFGKTKYWLGKAHKSYLGSTVFFVVSLSIGFFFSRHYGIIGLTLLLTLLEGASVRGTDNILLPTIAAVLLSVFA